MRRTQTLFVPPVRKFQRRERARPCVSKTVFHHLKGAKGSYLYLILLNRPISHHLQQPLPLRSSVLGKSDLHMDSYPLPPASPLPLPLTKSTIFSESGNRQTFTHAIVLSKKKKNHSSLLRMSVSLCIEAQSI